LFLLKKFYNFELRFLNLNYEKFEDANMGINREKQIKKYSRKKKLNLINKINPQNKSLNESIHKIDDEYL
jgi:predicted GIY-YIG superfamily endonuclease